MSSQSAANLNTLCQFNSTSNSKRLKHFSFIRKCCIPKCTSKYYNSSHPKYKQNKPLHQLPKDNERRLRWLTSIKNGTGIELPWDTKKCVCNDHFSDKSFASFSRETGTLINAVPTLFPLEVEEVDRVYYSVLSNSVVAKVSCFDLPTVESNSDYLSKIYQCRDGMIQRQKAKTASLFKSLLVDHDYCTSVPQTAQDCTVSPYLSVNIKSNTSQSDLTKTDDTVKNHFLIGTTECGISTKITFTDNKEDVRFNIRRIMKMKRRKQYLEKRARLKHLIQKIVGKRHNKVRGKRCSTLHISTRDMQKQQMTFLNKEHIFSLAKRHKTKHLSLESLIKTIILPYGSSLKALLHNMPLKSGINPVVFNRLAKKVTKLKDNEKRCVLMFQKLPLSVYSAEISKITSNLKKSNTTSHALIFMIQGINNLWKQPVAYYFVRNIKRTGFIKYTLLQVVSKLQETGFKVVATICKHSSDNRVVLSDLCKKADSDCKKVQPYFLVNKQKIFTVYDPTTLLLATRNILLTHNIEFEPQKFACFEHIQSAFDMDKKRSFPKLLKIRLKLRSCDRLRLNDVAARTFSYLTASCIEDTLGGHGIDTADFVHQMSQLLNSFNIKTKSLKGRRISKRNLRSSHRILLWERTIYWIKNWTFHNKINNRIERYVPTQQCWATTITATRLLWKIYGNKGCTFTENIKLEPLQDFIASIKHFGTTNKRLTASQFTAAFKVSLLNSSSFPLNIRQHSKEDGISYILDNYQDLFKTSIS